MPAEKVVTVTLPTGTRVTCREGLAARLAPSKPETPAKKAAAPRRRATATSDDSDK